MKAYIHIDSEYATWSNDIWAECEIPAVPHVDEMMWLPDEVYEELHKKIVDRFCEEAPLFTDEEALFRLSANAEVFEAVSFTSAGSPLVSAAIITVQPQNATGSWASAARYTTASTGRNFRQTLPKATYALAA